MPKGEVLEITKRFNIQVNNLTQVSFKTYNWDTACLLFVHFILFRMLYLFIYFILFCDGLCVYSLWAWVFSSYHKTGSVSLQSYLQ